MQNDKIIGYNETMSAATKILGRDFFKPYNDSAYKSGKLLSHLSIEAVSANYFECSKAWELKPRRINDSYWTWITRGKGTLRLGDNTAEYNVCKGDFILFPQYCLHSLKPAPGSLMSMINVHFHARLYATIDMVSYYKLGGIYKDCDNSLLKFNSHEAAREYCLKPEAWQRSLNARIELVILELVRKRNTFPEQNDKISKLSALQPVLEMIEGNLNNPDLSVRDMADKMDISEVYLRIIFRRQLGISPAKYLRRQRIDRACSLLCETALPIRLIAEKCGFREVQFFHRVFRDMTGTTPGSYRKNPDF